MGGKGWGEVVGAGFSSCIIFRRLPVVVLLPLLIPIEVL